MMSLFFTFSSTRTPANLFPQLCCTFGPSSVPLALCGARDCPTFSFTRISFLSVPFPLVLLALVELFRLLLLLLLLLLVESVELPELLRMLLAAVPLEACFTDASLLVVDELVLDELDDDVEELDELELVVDEDNTDDGELTEESDSSSTSKALGAFHNFGFTLDVTGDEAAL